MFSRFRGSLFHFKLARSPWSGGFINWHVQPEMGKVA
jgi:hypothetical protein